MTGSDPHFARVALIGGGLIGSSLARVMRRNGMADHIAICARTAATRARVLELEIADSATAEAAEAAADADIVVLCTPLSAYSEVAAAFAPA